MFANSGSEREVAVEVTATGSAAEIGRRRPRLAFLPRRMIDDWAEPAIADLDVPMSFVDLGVAVVRDRALSEAAAAPDDPAVPVGTLAEL